MPELEIIPQNDRILVEPIEVKNTTKSGLVINAGGDDKIMTSFAKILAVAETLKDDYKLGETIYFNEKAGVKFRLAGKSLVLLLKNEILAKIKTHDLESAINFQDLT